MTNIWTYYNHSKQPIFVYKEGAFGVIEKNQTENKIRKWMDIINDTDGKIIVIRDYYPLNHHILFNHKKEPFPFHCIQVLKEITSYNKIGLQIKRNHGSNIKQCFDCIESVIYMEKNIMKIGVHFENFYICSYKKKDM